MIVKNTYVLILKNDIPLKFSKAANGGIEIALTVQLATRRRAYSRRRNKKILDVDAGKEIALSLLQADSSQQPSDMKVVVMALIAAFLDEDSDALMSNGLNYPMSSPDIRLMDPNVTIHSCK